MKPADRIIEIFGGVSAMATALGHRNPTTVQGWKGRGYIPARQQTTVLKLAWDLRLPLKPEDFFEIESDGSNTDAA